MSYLTQNFFLEVFCWRHRNSVVFKNHQEPAINSFFPCIFEKLQCQPYHGKPFRKNRSLFSLCCACVRGAPQPRHTTRKAAVCDCGCLTCAFAEHLGRPSRTLGEREEIPKPMYVIRGRCSQKRNICRSSFLVRGLSSL